MQTQSVQENQGPSIEQILKRLSEVESTIQLLKQLYDEKERLTLQLMEKVGVGQEVQEGDYLFKVVDNFASKNVMFKSAAVRRFDLEVDSLSARQLRAKKVKKVDG
jgi:hypothetical protein